MIFGSGRAAKMSLREQNTENCLSRCSDHLETLQTLYGPFVPIFQNLWSDCLPFLDPSSPLSKNAHIFYFVCYVINKRSPILNNTNWPYLNWPNRNWSNLNWPNLNWPNFNGPNERGRLDLRWCALAQVHSVPLIRPSASFS